MFYGTNMEMKWKPQTLLYELFSFSKKIKQIHQVGQSQQPVKDN